MTGAESVLNLFRKILCTVGLIVFGFGILVAVTLHIMFIASCLMGCGILLIVLGLYITHIPKMPRSEN